MPKKQAVVAQDVLNGLLREKAGEIDAPDWLHIDTRRDALTQGGGIYRQTK